MNTLVVAVSGALLVSASPVFAKDAFSMAEVTRPSSQIVSNQFPYWADVEKASAGAILTVVVSPKGRIEKCLRERFVGNEKLADEICSHLRFLRFEPARNEAGKSIHAVMRLPMRYEHPKGFETKAVEEMADPVDAQLQISPGTMFPDEFDKFYVDTLVDRQGELEKCSGKADTPATLIDAACDLASRSPAEPLKIDGEPVEYVRRLNFKIAKLK